jgi:hypothetical protein
MERNEALATYLDIPLDDVEPSTYDECVFEADDAEYMVLDDDEADERAREYIRESVWAFNADFLAGYMVDGKLTAEQIDALRRDACESINDAFLAMIDDFDEFSDDAISTDGRAHFLNTYDGQEHEQGEWFIYRTS